MPRYAPWCLEVAKAMPIPEGEGTAEEWALVIWEIATGDSGSPADIVTARMKVLAERNHARKLLRLIHDGETSMNITTCPFCLKLAGMHGDNCALAEFFRKEEV